MAAPFERRPASAGASWVPFVVLLSLALGNFLTKPPLESERPVDGHAEKPNVARTQVYPETLTEDPLRILLDSTLDDAGAELVVPKDTIPVKPLRDAAGARGDVLLLPVIVNAGSNAVECERRRRTRYAVVSSLARADFVPYDSRHLGITCVKAPLVGEPEPKSRFVPMTFERFGPDDVKHIADSTSRPSEAAARPMVLVLWINVDEVWNIRLDSLLESIRASALGGAATPDSPPRAIRTSCLAAVGTDAVIRIFENLTKEIAGLELPPGYGGDVDVYLCRATAPSVNILRSAASRAKKPDLPWEPKEKRHQVAGGVFFEPEVIARRGANGSNGGLRFIRTLCDDAVMLDVIDRELELRGQSVRCDPRNVMLLVGEWDTSYSRAMRQYFLEQVGADARDRVLSIGYARGVDEGIVGGEASSPKPSVKTVDTTHGFGAGQVDYVRRAELEMAFVDESLRACDKRVSAVGILGTDIFDKIVILQAVKQIFPTSSVFTTDLDATFADPDRFDRYRNLLVASTFGLALDPVLQGSIPPFREALQASTMFATLDAVGFDIRGELGKQFSVKAELVRPAYSPRVFEIGRDGAFDLTGRAQSAWNVKRVPVEELAAYGVWAAETGADDVTTFVVDVNQKTRRGAVVVRWLRNHVFHVAALVAVAAGISVILSEKAKRVVRTAWTRVRLDPDLWTPWISAGILTLAVGALGASYCLSIVGDPDEEPVLFLAGISVWPSIWLRSLILVTCVFSAIWICQVRRRMPRSEGVVSRRDGPGAGRGAFFSKRYWLPRATWVSLWDRRSMYLTRDRIAPASSAARGEATITHVHGIRYEDLYHRLDAVILVRRTAVLVALLAVGAWFVQLPESPARGVARTLDRWLSISSSIAVAAVVILANGVVRTVRRFVEIRLDDYRDHFRRISDVGGDVDAISLEGLHDCQRLRDVSGLALNCLYPPSLVVLLLTLCYNPLFDAWHWSLWLAAPFLALAIVLVFNAWSLGRTTTRVRAAIVEGLRNSVEVKGDESVKGLVRGRVERILTLEGGAFTRFLDMPLVRAVMIPISGAGGLSLIQYLTPILG